MDPAGQKWLWVSQDVSVSECEAQDVTVHFMHVHAYETTPSTTENDAIERHHEHKVYEAAGVTCMPCYSKRFHR